MSYKILCTCAGCGHAIDPNDNTYCDFCTEDLKTEYEEKVESLKEALKELQTQYDELLEKYNSPLNKFVRGEYKVESKEEEWEPVY